jgi:protein gp37
VDKLEEPLRWRNPCRIFVDSMSELFYEEFTNEQIAAVFGVMAACPQHTFQVLTKRPARAVEWFRWMAQQQLECDMPWTPIMRAASTHLPDAVAVRLQEDGIARDGVPSLEPWPLPNVWIGTSVEDQQRADERLPHLLRIPAAVRFISYEPALEAVDYHIDPDATMNRFGLLSCPTCRGWGVIRLRQAPDVHGNEPERYCSACDSLGTGIHWVIVGGESGHGARPFDIAWARNAVRQCKAAGVPVFVKQLGAQPGEYIEMAPQTLSVHGADRDGDYKCMQGTGTVPASVRSVRHDGKTYATYSMRDKKGGDPSEWPEDLRIREFPHAD